MSEQQQQLMMQEKHDSLDSMARAYDQHKFLLAESDEQKAKILSQEREIALLQQEIKNLTAQVRKLTGQNVHLTRVHAGTQSSLEHLGTIVLEAVKKLQNHSYDGAEPTPQQPERLNDERIIPRLPLRTGAPLRPPRTFDPDRFVHEALGAVNKAPA